MKTLTIDCPDRLHEQLAELVAAGWFKSPKEAVRRYLSLHSEKQIKADVQWALNER